ncbi:S1C family serine protease [Actinoplanes aureus]|uniref:Trypsin-like peptidase domain-containing protein n=1 Tax=Actinoplanes aureus TaxID=2792083 RepID=A0A931FYH6_9ACTN|nr:trypsin-like peptidase domain-containing protein [Actinoplanes aureus]MBG0564598.1 trypsin-like peptidase domain-containing protein [Actinoplanes aureus]
MDTANDNVPATGSGGDWGWRVWVSAAVAAVLGAVIGGLVVNANEPSAGSPSGGSSTVAIGPDKAATCAATAVAEKVLPSVVTISASSGESGGTGSGEVIRAEGYILTNNHVISVAADGGQVSVLFNDGRSVPATITGRDPKADLAVIKVDGQQSLPVIPFGQSKDVVVGQPVVALGAPLGLSNTVTSGIISALDRTIEVPGDAGENALLVSALQTDAAINPGNSGGALVNCQGQLVGVPSAGATIPSSAGGGGSAGDIGLGFAIPVDLAKLVSDEIIETGTVTHAWFGVSVITVPPTQGQPGGVYVRSVVPGGPAAKAGLQTGDMITGIDGKPVTSTNDLAAVTLTKRPGDTVTVDYTRGGKPASAKVTLGAQQ